MNIRFKSFKNVISENNEIIYNFKRTDFCGLFNELECCSWSELANSHDIENSVSLFYNKIFECFDKYVPTFVNKHCVKKEPWYNHELVQLKKGKKNYVKR